MIVLALRPSCAGPTSSVVCVRMWRQNLGLLNSQNTDLARDTRRFLVGHSNFHRDRQKNWAVAPLGHIPDPQPRYRTHFGTGCVGVVLPCLEGTFSGAEGECFVQLTVLVACPGRSVHCKVRYLSEVVPLAGALGPWWA